MLKSFIKSIPVIAATALLAIPAAMATFTPILTVAQGGTGATTSSGARSSLGAAASGANSDITSISGLTTALSIAQGGTNATTAAGARTSLGAAASGANSDITSLTGLTTPLSIAQGGTAATTASGARTSLGAAASGANSDITSLSGLTTALSAPQGGTGFGTYTTGDILYASSSSALSKLPIGTNGQELVVSGGLPVWAPNTPSVTVTQFTAAGTAVAGFDQTDATTAAFALTLPTGQVTGTRISVKKTDSSANAVTVTRGGTSKIDGVNTYILSSQYQGVTVIYDGTDWNIE